MSRYYTYFVAFVGVVCAYFIARFLFFTDLSTRTIPSDVLQGLLIGFGLAVVAAEMIKGIKGAKENGWLTMYGLGKPGNGMFLRAAHALAFPGPVVVSEEAMYWYTHEDGAGHALSGTNDYVIHFPAGQLPPNNAFWSLTMGDAKNKYVRNPLKRYSVSDRSGLVPNSDGSVDIYIQNASPVGHESNWLPAPTGNFTLWLRAYLPGAAILDRTYVVPPVVKVK